MSGTLLMARGCFSFRSAHGHWAMTPFVGQLTAFAAGRVWRVAGVQRADGGRSCTKNWHYMVVIRPWDDPANGGLMVTSRRLENGWFMRHWGRLKCEGWWSRLL